MINRVLSILLATLVLGSCHQKEEAAKEWVYNESVSIEGVNPIGIAPSDDGFWLSDGDHNRLVKISRSGEVVQVIDSLDRPMHIDNKDNTLFVPQYGEDNVATFKEGIKGAVEVQDSLDAPAGVSIYENQKAIADFYNNRVLFYNGKDWISIGKEGKADGEFYYPTDVQITEDFIWVADAYNHRVQVFDKEGAFLKVIGQDQKMNAATGIYVSDQELFVTDFENDRVLIFDTSGSLKQVLEEHIHKPTDMILEDDTLYIINYRNGELIRYELQEVESIEK